MAGSEAKLSANQGKAIVALLTTSSISEAAATAGIGERTLFRWMQRDSFQQAYREAKRQAVGQAISHLQRCASDAVRALQDVVNDAEAPASTRVSAAKAVLEMAVKAVELEDVESRVAVLEAQAGGWR